MTREEKHEDLWSCLVDLGRKYKRRLGRLFSGQVKLFADPTLSLAEQLETADPLRAEDYDVWIRTGRTAGRRTSSWTTAPGDVGCLDALTGDWQHCRSMSCKRLVKAISQARHRIIQWFSCCPHWSGDESGGQSQPRCGDAAGQVPPRLLAARQFRGWCRPRD